LSPRDIALGLLTAFVWGVTFIFIRMGVESAPPLALSALRFAFAAFPAILFVRPPRARASIVTLYGLLLGVGQFGLLFLAIENGMPIGLASLVIQVQAFVTVGLAFLLLGAACAYVAVRLFRRRPGILTASVEQLDRDQRRAGGP